MGHKAPTSYFVRDGYSIILLTLVVALLVAYFYSLKWAVLPLLLACFFTFFFRIEFGQFFAATDDRQQRVGFFARTEPEKLFQIQ